MKIRAATPEDVPGIARVHVASWQTTYAGMMPDEFLASLSVEQRESRWHRIIVEYGDSNYVYVVEDDTGQIIGFISGGPQRDEKLVEYTAELYAVYLLQSARALAANWSRCWLIG